MARIALHLSGDADADAVLSRDPLALLIGMVLDQQVTLEKAFSSPAELARRLGGSLDAASIAAMDPGELADIFRERPALHRYPGSMAARVQEVCRTVVEDYGGKADAIWKGVASGEDLVARIRGPARVRGAEVQDLHGAARQAARRAPRGVAGGQRPLRR